MRAIQVYILFRAKESAHAALDKPMMIEEMFTGATFEFVRVRVCGELLVPTTVGAAQAFRRDASDSEVKAVRREWNAWRTELEQVSAEEIAKAVREVGSACRPESTANLDQVGGALGEGRS